VRPEVVAEIAFTQWTKDGLLRHPSFQGIREDKAASEVRRERPQERPPAGAESSSEDPEGRMRAKPRLKAGRSGTEDSERVAGVPITHPEKILYPEQGVTKKRLAEYYERVAGRMLPHVADRPLVLLRCPEGRLKHCFFQKHFESGAPAHVRVVSIREQTGKEASYGVIHDVGGLVALVQMGVLEIHVWGSRASRVEKPERLVFDVDPDEGLAWERVVDAALLLKERLSALGFATFLTTTGGKGVHVVVPLVARSGWEEVQDFARALAEAIEREQPERYTSRMSKARRVGKVFIDYLRNSRGASAIAPYSPRAREGAPVSLPIGWAELGASPTRSLLLPDVEVLLLGRERDPWAGFEEARVALTKRARALLGR
jgi:bifunctional non-homologous end joining protein LigD